MGTCCETPRKRGDARADTAWAPGGLYRPRSPRASPLWQCAKRHANELREAGRLRRAVEQQALERVLACGDPHYGFARIYCNACGHDYLLAYSCKTRYFCPSCHHASLRRVGRRQRPRARPAPPVRVHRPAALAPWPLRLTDRYVAQSRLTGIGRRATMRRFRESGRCGATREGDAGVSPRREPCEAGRSRVLGGLHSSSATWMH